MATNVKKMQSDIQLITGLLPHQKNENFGTDRPKLPSLGRKYNI